MRKKLNVLVVDDTLTSRHLLKSIINRSGDMQVIGEGSDGEDAVRLTRELKPDLVLMDIIMARMDGLEATRRIMSQNPLPIVLVTASLESQETDVAYRGLKAGALTVMRKPQGLIPREISQLTSTLRALSSVQVIHHYNRSASEPAKGRPQPVDRPPAQMPEIIGIAASTGGPAALYDILHGLPGDFPLPIVIVQHMSPEFVVSLRDWLAAATPLKVHIAKAGMHPEPGNVYIAPGEAHLGLAQSRRFVLDSNPGGWRYMPSCDALLYSLAEIYGARVLGVVLTGMGDDGADGLRAIFDAGGVTIAQDASTSVVFGMPQEAQARGGAAHVRPLQEIADLLKLFAEEGEPQ